MISRTSMLLNRLRPATFRTPTTSVSSRFPLVARLSSTSGGGGSSDNDEKDGAINKKPSGNQEDDDDIFGVHYEDGEDRMGPQSAYPPRFERDPVSGTMTGQVEQELTAEDRQMLTADSLERDKVVEERMTEHWMGQGKDWANNMGRAVREAQMGLNVIGRSTQAQSAKQVPDGQSEEDAKATPTGFSQRLTRKEFQSFRAYMDKQHNQKITEDDVPVMDNPVYPDSVKTGRTFANSQDEPEVSTEWMTNAGRRRLESDNDDLYADVMPSDLMVQRLVNRRDAKRIPTQLLHHNNVALLKSFLSPTAQLKHRMHTRLGARDQRKIAKLVKRARQMGLLPYQNEFSVEEHGWIHAPDIQERRSWEDELDQRGLVVKKPPPKEEEEGQGVTKISLIKEETVVQV